MTDERTPDLSVVIPSVNGWGDLEGCLGALERQVGDIVLDIIVADRVGESVRSHLRNRADVQLIESPPETAIPELRAQAFEAARAAIVAVIEDHVIVPPEWAGMMIEAQMNGAQVVGGSVQNVANERLIDIAAFICEYNHCLAPPSGPSDWVVGNNVTYRRELLEEFRDTVREQRWENHLHDAFSRKGITLLSVPAIKVGHKKHYTIAQYTHQRFLYSRSFAGMRVAGEGVLTHVALGFAALALPPILLQRLVSRVWKTGLYRTELVLSLPLQVLFTFSWAAGEVVGYWFGPGDSLRKVC